MESYTIIDNDIWKDNNIKGYEKLVLIYLIRNFNVNYGYSFPLREQIQEATGISKDTLNKVLNSLEEKGYITRSKREGKAGRNNIYYIHKYLVGQQDSPQGSTEPKPIKDKPKPTEAVTKPQNQSKANKPLTRYHGTFNEHYQKYNYDDLEAKLLKSQEEKKNAAVKAFREKIG